MFLSYQDQKKVDESNARKSAELAELKIKQNKILENIRSGVMKIQRADLMILEPRDRIHYSRVLKVIN